MARTVSGRILMTLTALLQDSVGLAAAQGAVDNSYIKTITTGIGADQCDRIYSERGKSISAAYDVDLSGALTDALGQAFVIARAKALLVIADPTNSGNIVIGNDANGALIGFGANTHTMAIRPGGVLFLYAPDATAYAITATTADILQFAPSAGTQLFDFAVMGASA